MDEVTIQDSIRFFIKAEINKKLSSHTIRTYTYGCSLFAETLTKQGINPTITKVAFVSEEWIKYFLNDLTNLAPRTAHVYVQAVKLWYDYIAESYGVPVNSIRLKLLIRSGLPELITISPTEPDYTDVLSVINYVQATDSTGFSEGQSQIRFLRDKAIILTLADTGIDVESLCGLIYGDFDTKKKRFNLDKRDRGQAVDISRRANLAIINYLKERADKYPNFARNPNSFPIFARHDKGAGQRVLPITPATVRNLIKDRAREAFRDDNLYVDISPIWFRYYYEKTVAQSIGVLLHSKILERCYELFLDGHYENAVFDAMKVIEEEIRKKSKSANSDIGVNLISIAMGGNSPKISFSSDVREQEFAFALFRGAIGYFKILPAIGLLIIPIRLKRWNV